MLKFCSALAAALSLSACATSLATSPATPPATDLRTWELVTVPPAPLADSLRILPDGVIAISGNPVGYLASPATYTDYRLRFDWRWSARPGNAGALLHIASGPKDRAWPLSIQVQTKHGNVGDVLPMAGAGFAEPLTSAPGAQPQIKARTAADSEQPAGAWNTADIVSRAGTIAVSINGVAQNQVSGATPASGRIGFQLEGTPFELRNVRIDAL
jgi:hypothetical protein